MLGPRQAKDVAVDAAVEVLEDAVEPLRLLRLRRHHLRCRNPML